MCIRDSLYALAGQLMVRATSGLVATDRPFTFGAETRSPVSGATWDQRLTVRNACSGPSDCAAEGQGGCGIRCSAETLTCTNVEIPDLAACDGGFCCGGECRASGTCEFCSDF